MLTIIIRTLLKAFQIFPTFKVVKDFAPTKYLQAVTGFKSVTIPTYILLYSKLSPFYPFNSKWL